MQKFSAREIEMSIHRKGYSCTVVLLNFDNCVYCNSRWSNYSCLEVPILMLLTKKIDELSIGQLIWVCTFKIYSFTLCLQEKLCILVLPLDAQVEPAW